MSFSPRCATGIDPDGHTLGGQMPWRVIGRMSDDDLRTVYEILWICPKPEIKA